MGKHGLDEGHLPEPILMAIATSLATKAATGIYDLVKKKFSGDKKAIAALESAKAAPSDETAVKALAERLEVAEADDAEFAGALRSEWQNVQVDQHAERGGVTNSVTGNVSGKVVQARDIHGNVTF